MFNARTFSHRRFASRQNGVVLIVALVMLVVISLASVAIMRNTMGGDRISDNTRRHTQALQAAQAALRYCENEVLTMGLTPQAAADAPGNETWRAFENWSADRNIRKVVSEKFMTGTDQPPPPNLPECMAQFRAVGSDTVVIITARGFSDNYIQTNGHTEAGSVVWLQSILQLAANAAG